MPVERLSLLLVSSRWLRAAARPHFQGREGIQDLAQVREVAFNHRHSAADLRYLIVVTSEQREHLLEVWNEHFNR